MQSNDWQRLLTQHRHDSICQPSTGQYLPKRRSCEGRYREVGKSTVPVFHLLRSHPYLSSVERATHCPIDDCFVPLYIVCLFVLARISHLQLRHRSLGDVHPSATLWRPVPATVWVEGSRSQRPTSCTTAATSAQRLRMSDAGLLAGESRRQAGVWEHCAALGAAAKQLVKDWSVCVCGGGGGGGCSSIVEVERIIISLKKIFTSERTIFSLSR